MVAVITGHGLGTERGSGFVLGSRGQLGSSAFGRYGENVYVNAATGNLAIQRQDDFLIGVGIDDDVERSYNSLGTMSDDNGDNWQLGQSRTVTGFTGTLNTAGSTITRYDWDGSDVVYTWNAARSAYVSTEGAGADDTLTFGSNVWTWTDGDAKTRETYDSLNGGRITATKDNDGNTLAFTYTGNLLTRVTTANGEHTDYSYTGNNLTQVVTTRSDGTTETRVSYSYDTSNRLSAVTTDLSPDDNSVSDANIVKTTYTYDGSSKRVASITQSGGAKLAITYALVGSTYRVATLTQTQAYLVTSATTFSYDTTNRITTVTDAQNNVTKLTYDTSNRLISLEQPAAVSGNATEVSNFTYTSTGHVASISDALGNQTVLTYDTHDNLTYSRDAAGNTVSYTYDANNNRLTTTHYLVPDPDGAGSGAAGTPITTRYAYDAENHLVYSVSDEGRVTRYTYAANGLPTRTTDYATNLYDTSGLSASTSITASTLDSWTSGISDKSGFHVTDTGHDPRGNVTTVTSYTATDASAGTGLTTLAYTRETYVYDQAGNLLSRHDNASGAPVETFIYDGLDRLIGSTDLAGNSTSIVFTDSTDTCVLTAADGSTTTTVHDRAGEIVSTSLAGSGVTSMTTTDAYDSLGNLRMVTNALGQKSYFLYDNLGRKIADIQADGTFTETAYDGAGRVIHTIRYIAKLTADQMTTKLVDANGNPAPVDRNTMWPPSNTADSWDWTVYDKANRIVETIDSSLAATTFTYDGASRLVGTTSYADQTYYPNAPNLRTTDPTSIILPLSSSGHDQITRYFYDDDGLLAGTIDGAGAFIRNYYDAAGQKTQTVRYAAPSSLWATGSFSAIVANVQPSILDRRERQVYDDEGQLAYSLDELSHPTAYSYDVSGNLYRTTQYAGSISAPSDGNYSASYVASQISSQNLDADTANRVTRSIHDAAGRVVFSVDAAGDITQFVYDAAGRVTKTIDYSAITTSTIVSLASWQSYASSHANDANNRVSYTLYDGVSRPVYQVDALGYVTQTQYDALGRTTNTIRYADTYPVSDTTSTASLKVAIGTAPATAVNTRMSYDSAGRMTDITRDVTSSTTVTTHYDYDALDQVTDITVAYGSATDAAITHMTYDVAGNVKTRTSAYGTDAATTSSYVYDGVGNLLWQIDGNGNSTFYSYDAQGNVTREAHAGAGTMPAVAVDNAWYNAHYTLQYGSTPTDDYNNGGWQAGRDPNPYFSTSVYLAYNPDVAAAGVNPLTHYLQYGWREGRAPTLYYSSTDYYEHYGNSTDVTKNSYDAFGNLISSTDGKGYTTYRYYNAYDQVQLEVDRAGYATGYSYSIGGAVTSITHYATVAGGSYNANTYPTITTDADDATTGFTLDKLDRVTKVTDAMGFYEQYTLDAFGDRVSVRNKLGGITTNVFDGRGLLTSETLPQNSVNSDGSVQASTVTNTYGYDARGNRIQMVEASGLTEQRTTNYRYDKMNRLISVTHDAVNVTSIYMTTATGTTVPSESIQYDLRGNIIEQKDAAGARTLSYWDDNDRKIAEISPTGTLSTWTYDDNDNALTAVTYGDNVTLPTTAGGTPPAPVNASNYRQTSYTYDRDDRMLTSTVASIFTGAYSGSTYATATSDLTTTNAYDAAGNLIETIDANGGKTYFFYDKNGRKTAEVDANNYLTVSTLDADGNVSLEERFATKIAGTVTTTSDPIALKASVDGNADDRNTSFTYDMNGNRLTETRSGLVAWTVDSTGALTTAATTATVIYTYNGLGEVTSKQEATGDTTTYAYDTAGRQSSVTNAGFYDLAGNWTQRLTSNFYDGLGDLTRTTVTGTGGSPGTRVTTYAYGAGGRLASVTDASGFVTSYGYDIAGRTVKASYARVKSDGSTSVTEARATRYDLAGRITYQAIGTLSGSTWSFGDNSQTKYDAYGEVSAKGVNGLWQQTYVYDAAGRVARATEADGTTQLYVYDKVGNATLTISSSSSTDSGAPADLSAQTVLGALNLLTGNNAHTVDAGSQNTVGMAVTIGVFDQRGQQIATRMPFRDLTASTRANIVSSQKYNAFGEVIQTTDGQGGITDYAYNTEGKIVSSKAPTAGWTDEHGTIHTTDRATQLNYYDISGRLIGVRDANASYDADSDGNPDGIANTLLLRAGTGYDGEDADTLKEFHADGGVLQKDYDVFGDLRCVENELQSKNVIASRNAGTLDAYFYDGMDRLIEHDHAKRADGTRLIDWYGYDGLGQRTSHANSQLGAIKETTDYDSQGRVVSMVDLGGDTTTYSYVWDASIVTNGMGTYGGWTKKTNDPASGNYVEVETLDVFGHEVGKSDAGHHTFTYSFDAAGRQVETAVSTGGDSLTSWYNSGLIASTTDGTLSGSTFTPGAVSTYGYDADGNRTREIYSVAGVGKQNATVAWDAMNRMTSFTDTGQSGVNDSAAITYEYDQNSNIRRMAATYYVLDGQGNFSTTTASQEDWYRYDSMNRFVTTKGMLSGTDGNGVVQTGANARGFGAIGGGDAILYDAAGERTSVTSTITRTAPLRFYVPSTTPSLTRYYDDNGGINTIDDGQGTWSDVNYSYASTQVENYSYTTDGYLAGVSIAQQALNDIPDGGVRVPTVAALGAAVNRAAYNRDAMGRVVDYDEYATDGTVTYSSHVDLYNDRSQIVDETTTSLIGSDTYVTKAHNDYGAYNGTTGKYDGAYQGGVVTHSTSNTTKNGSFSSSDDTVNAFTWWDDAEQASTAVATHYPGGGNDTDFTSTYSYDALGNLTTVTIQDGRPRTVSFLTNAQGEIIQRDEADANASTGDPRQVYYFFEGTRVGDISNDGTSDTDYATSIASHTTAAPTTPGPFRNGAATGTSYADFDQSYDPINGLNYDSTAGTYTVADGDTLESIAQTVWGDASLWYMLADANGLDGTEALVSGRDLIVPNKIANIHNNASTYKVYDPNDAIGNTAPTDPKPSKHHSNHCGAFGQILIAAVAIAITVALPEVAPATFGAGSGILGAVEVATIASVASQGVGIAIGAQDKFSFKALAESVLTAGVGAGPQPTLSSVVNAVIDDALVQGVELATGLEHHLDWAGVAAAGVTAGVIGLRGAAGQASAGARIATSAASAIAAAGTRSLLTGTDFGDTILQVLPNVIGQTVGTLAVREIAGNRAPRLGYAGVGTDDGVTYTSGQTGAGDGSAVQPQAGEGGGQVGRSASSGGNYSGSVPGEIVVTAPHNGWTDYQYNTYETLVDNAFASAFNAGGYGPADGVVEGIRQAVNAMPTTTISPQLASRALHMFDSPDMGFGNFSTFLQNNTAANLINNGLYTSRTPRSGVTLDQIGAMESDPFAAIGGGFALLRGANSQEINRDIALGQGIGGMVFAGGAMAGAIPYSGNQIGLQPTTDLALTYKPGWSDSQIAEANAKVQILDSADTVAIQTAREGTSARTMFTKAGGSVPAGNDIDHMIDLQLGGSDTVGNLWPLNSSVNRSLGPQIQYQIRDLPPGTRINNVTIGPR